MAILVGQRFARPHPTCQFFALAEILVFRTGLERTSTRGRLGSKSHDSIDPGSRFTRGSPTSLPFLVLNHHFYRSRNGLKLSYRHKREEDEEQRSQERQQVYTPEITTNTSISFLSHSRLVRETIAARLRLEEGIRFITAASSIHQLRQHLSGRPVDVVLVHTNIDGVLGRELVWDAKTVLPATHLIVLAYRRSKQDLIRWAEAGAMAYLEQETSITELLETIRDVAGGGHPRCSISLLTRVVESSRQMTHLKGRPGVELLSDRELEFAIRQPSDLPNKKSRPQTVR